MLKTENVVLPSPKQWEATVKGMRNPKNSWDNSDSNIVYISDEDTCETADFEFLMGEKDEALCKTLAGAGSVHGKFLRMLPVYVDITAPLYWWKEFDTYKVGTVANSCSTMHKIAEKDFEVSDFSCEHLLNPYTGSFHSDTMEVLYAIIYALNKARKKFLETNDKAYWWHMIQLLPSSYNQKRTVMLNYEVLRNIYEYRHNHKLDEWHIFCDWIKTLPHSDFIIDEKMKEDD